MNDPTDNGIKNREEAFRLLVAYSTTNLVDFLFDYGSVIGVVMLVINLTVIGGYLKYGISTSGTFFVL